ncbi:MAG TPA: DnaJ domain-containing protein, partial [Jatrophihabitans sp.]|nr:DnaJ domain-containing protein [Jatrophihabitans sp.]
MAGSVRDYYGMLNVAHDATAEEIKRAYRKLARELHPDVNPDPAAQNKFKDITAAYEVLSDPQKRRIVDLGGDPLAPSGGAGGQGFTGFGGFGDIFETFFGGGAARGPRSRVRQGADALLRLELSMVEMAFGVQKDIAVETAVVCQSCRGDGCAPGTSPRTCGTCNGSGEVQSMQRSLLGPVMTSRPCHTCGGTGQQIPSPCPTCAGEGRVRARR